jgi:hypothetical protein
MSDAGIAGTKTEWEVDESMDGVEEEDRVTFKLAGIVDRTALLALDTIDGTSGLTVTVMVLVPVIDPDSDVIPGAVVLMVIDDM